MLEKVHTYSSGTKCLGSSNGGVKVGTRASGGNAGVSGIDECTALAHAGVVGLITTASVSADNAGCTVMSQIARLIKSRDIPMAQSGS